MASLISTARAPLTPYREERAVSHRNPSRRGDGGSRPLTRSSVVMGTPPRLVATTILARRWRMSSRLLVRASTAMISLATVMSNWAWKTESPDYQKQCSKLGSVRVTHYISMKYTSPHGCICIIHSRCFLIIVTNLHAIILPLPLSCGPFQWATGRS